MTKVPSDYNLNNPIPFNRTCELCTKLARGTSVGGAGPKDLSQVKLIVISDYPSNLEEEAGYPLFDNEEKRSQTRVNNSLTYIKWRNAGNFLRYELNRLFGLNTYTDTWITNAVKCNPFHKKEQITITEGFMKTCTNTWLLNELQTLHQHQLTCPILIAGTTAFRALQYVDNKLYSELTMANGKKAHSLKDYRRVKGKFWLTHPLVFTVNPAGPAKSVARIETHEVKTKVFRVQELPYLIGSPPWQFQEDIKLLAEYL